MQTLDFSCKILRFSPDFAGEKWPPYGGSTKERAFGSADTCDVSRELDKQESTCYIPITWADVGSFLWGGFGFLVPHD